MPAFQIQAQLNDLTDKYTNISIIVKDKVPIIILYKNRIFLLEKNLMGTMYALQQYKEVPPIAMYRIGIDLKLI